MRSGPQAGPAGGLENQTEARLGYDDIEALRAAKSEETEAPSVSLAEAKRQLES